ncbi:MAG: catalase [Lachnospiraceae bacterium]|nr:catalase [Lachnospiraceae bacterium]
MKAWQHFKTITNHKRLVRAGCFRVGLYRQGIMHDWSKYNPVEFLVGCRYYQGNMSPNNVERVKKGYSSAWLHHKGRNKHHMEYWIDYSAYEKKGVCGMKMPVKYVVEMFIDRMSASKNYLKETYTNKSPLEYYENGKNIYLLHPETRELLERLLHMLAEQGEEATYEYIRKEILKNKK